MAFLIIKIIKTGLNLSGNNVSIQARTIQDGGIYFTPLLDNFFRTFHSKPQVIVTINGQVSNCSGSCDFEWNQNSTPFVDSIDQTNKSELIIYGEGFSVYSSENIVQIGSTICRVKQATRNKITCQPGLFIFFLH